MTRSFHIPNDVFKEMKKLVSNERSLNKIVTDALIQYLNIDRPKSTSERLDEIDEKFETVFKFIDRVESRMERER